MLRVGYPGCLYPFKGYDMRYDAYGFIDFDIGDDMHRFSTFMIIISENDVIIIKIWSYDYSSWIRVKPTFILKIDLFKIITA